MGENQILSEDFNFLFEIGSTRKLKYLLTHLPENITYIDAAVAYTTEKKYPQDVSLVDLCLQKKIKLNWWGLFNSDGGTSLTEIKKALSNPALVTFYPFSKNFHSKVIYFHGYGIYVGSHNFTYNALMYNVEAGIFVKECNLSEKQKNDITDFFAYLKKNSIPAVADDLDRIEEYEDLTQGERKQEHELKKRLEHYFEEQFSHMFKLKEGVLDYSDDDSQKKREFIQEWRRTQNIIEHIKQTIEKTCIQPDWVDKNADYTIITDQLLHAYYYSYVLQGKGERKTGKIIAAEKEKNKGNTDYAIQHAIKWWESLKAAPMNENVYINKWGIENKTILQTLKTGDLTEEQLEKVLSQNHAARTHARQMQNKQLKLPKDFSTTQDERVKIYSKWLYQQKSKKGMNISAVMRYLLFDESETIENKVYNCVYEKEYKIEHFGKSIIGELLGWGRPDITHIRNNRVNKVLNCLGYDVELFSE